MQDHTFVFVDLEVPVSSNFPELPNNPCKLLVIVNLYIQVAAKVAAFAALYLPPMVG